MDNFNIHSFPSDSNPDLRFRRKVALPTKLLCTENERYDSRFCYSLDHKDNKRGVIDFCIKMSLITWRYECPLCKSSMNLTERKEKLEG